MIDIEIINFRNIRRIIMHDDTPMSIIVGYNEGGKSSFCGAIEFCCTGAAFGRKGKEAAGLITIGEDAMRTRVTIGNHRWSRTKAGGDSIDSIASDLGVHKDVLPLMFNSKLCRDGGSKAIKTFLDTSLPNRFDPNASFIDQPEIRACIEQCRKAGQFTTAQIVRFSEQQRAASKVSAEPMLPGSDRPNQEDMEKARQSVESLRNEMLAAKAELTELDNTTRGIAAIVTYLKAMESHEAIKKTALLIDTLPNREALTKVASINIRSLNAIGEIIEAGNFAPLPMKQAAAFVETCIFFAKQELARNPAPTQIPAEPVLSEAGTAILPQLEQNGDDTPEKLNALLMNAAGMRPQLEKAVSDANSILLEAKLRLESMLRIEGAWQQYDLAIPIWKESSIRANLDWQRWDNCAKGVKAAEDEHLSKAGDAFGSLISTFADDLLQGRRLTISRENGIMLNGMEIGVDTSESTMWRIEICVMAAIARTQQSPLLVIDAADILDAQNRGPFLNWLFNRIIPNFQHTILTMTPRGKIEEEGVPPPGATKWIINKGELTKLLAAQKAES